MSRGKCWQRPAGCDSVHRSPHPNLPPAVEGTPAAERRLGNEAMEQGSPTLTFPSRRKGLPAAQRRVGNEAMEQGSPLPNLPPAVEGTPAGNERKWANGNGQNGESAQIVRFSTRKLQGFTSGGRNSATFCDILRHLLVNRPPPAGAPGRGGSGPLRRAQGRHRQAQDSDGREMGASGEGANVRGRPPLRPGGLSPCILGRSRTPSAATLTARPAPARRRPRGRSGARRGPRGSSSAPAPPGWASTLPSSG